MRAVIALRYRGESQVAEGNGYFGHFGKASEAKRFMKAKGWVQVTLTEGVYSIGPNWHCWDGKHNLSAHILAFYKWEKLPKAKSRRNLPGSKITPRKKSK